MVNDKVREAIERAVEIYAGTGSQNGIFNLAGFSQALKKQLGSKELVDKWKCKVLLEGRMDIEPVDFTCVYHLKRPILASPPRPTPEHIPERTSEHVPEHAPHNNNEIRAFYKMCCKDAGRKIKDPLPDSELKFWGDAMKAVEKNYIGRRRRPIGEINVSALLFNNQELVRLGLPIFSPWNEIYRRRRIKYARALICKDEDTTHLSEKGWAFWEKVMQNLDAEYATKKKIDGVFERKTTDQCAGKQYSDYLQFFRDFAQPMTIGIDYWAEQPDTDGLFIGVVKKETESFKTENELLKKKVMALDIENDRLKTEIRASKHQRPDTQEIIRALLKDVAGFVMGNGAGLSGQSHFARLRKLAGLSE